MAAVYAVESSDFNSCPAIQLPVETPLLSHCIIEAWNFSGIVPAETGVHERKPPG